jgi:DNA-binding transcriptional regulator YbjK
MAVEEAVRAASTSCRRRQVVDTAVKVIGKTGFHQTSMQDLATEANVSVGLIYKYFTASSSWWPGSAAISRSSTKTSTRWC